MQTSIKSEISEFEWVIYHTSEHEIENITPENAERSLNGVFLNLSIASMGYALLDGVFKKNSTASKIIKADDIVLGRTNIIDYSKFIITIAGFEFAFKGRDARCTALPADSSEVS